jgi:hypothetical protein
MLALRRDEQQTVKEILLVTLPTKRDLPVQQRQRETC